MAGFTDQDEDVPYLSVPTAPGPKDEVDRDEEEFSSLVEAQKVLNEGYDSLKYDLTEVNDENEDDLKVEIRSRKRARAILDPVKQIIDEAVKAVEAKRKGR